MTAHTTKIDVNDPRLTAYALGELAERDATEIAAAVAADRALQAEVAAIRAFGATLEAELADEPAPDLGAEARAAIATAGDAAANDDDAPAVRARRWYAQPRWLIAAGLFVAAGSAAAIALTSSGPHPAPMSDADAPSARVDERPEAAPEPLRQPELNDGPAADEGAAEKAAAGAEASGSPVAGTSEVADSPEGEAARAQSTPSADDVAEPHGRTGAKGLPATPATKPSAPMSARAPRGRATTELTPLDAADLANHALGAEADPKARDGGSRTSDRAKGGKMKTASAGDDYDGDLVAGGGSIAAPDAGGATGGVSGGPTLPLRTLSANEPSAAMLGVLAGEDGAAVGRGDANIPMLRGAGGIVVDTVTVPSGAIVTMQMPDGSLVRRHIGHAAYDPTPYWFNPSTQRWYYDYDYYYYNQAPQGGGGEAYAPIYESPFKRVDSEPLSTFSTDVDTASYANVRRFLDQNQRPPRDAVRIEEMVNAFTYATPQPRAGEPLTVQAEVAGCPWAPTHRLVRVTLAAREVERAQRPAGNLVFLVDTSGSMGSSNKLPLLKRALRDLVAQLDERDTVTIVTYAGRAGVALKPTNGSEKATILRAVAGLHASGMTNGSAGLEKAYELAREHYIEGGTNRVLLATDGDFNAGMTSRYALVQQVAAAAAADIYLTVLGLGTGNLNDDTLEAISNRGNGTYAYLDGYEEARRVLVDQLTKTLVTVAKDVKLQVEWNPTHVLAYRLIGYENRAMANADFDNDRKDAGDMGAGATVTALYEVVPTGTTPPPKPLRHLKYQQPPEVPETDFTGPPAPADVAAEMMTVKVRYKAPESSESESIEVPLVDDGTTLEGASDDFRWAASVAGFGMMLRRSYYRGNAFWGQIHGLALGAVADDPNGERTEMLRLVTKAGRLYGWR